jgi:hypothetical protein
MPYAIKQLLARGYWKAAGDDGSSGGGGSGDDGKGGEGGNDGGNAGGDEGGDGEGDGGSNDGSGKAKPTDAEAKLLKELMKNKKDRQAAEAALAQANEQLAKFRGLDAEKIRAMLAEAEERATKELEAKGQWDALKKQLVEAHGSALTEKEAKINEALQKYAEAQAKIAELTVGSAFGQSEFLSKKVAWSTSKVRQLFGAHFEFNGEAVVAYDKPAGAKDRAVLVDAKGDPLSFEAAIEKFVMADPDRDLMLKSDVRPGAGSKTEKGGAAPARTTELSGRDRIKAALAAKK